MRIIHTSDWHLGRRLLGIDLSTAHRAFLDWLTELVKTERPDALLIAGDIFDRTFPPEESVALLDDALVRLTEQTHVVMIPGNHDSATRLGFTSRLTHPHLHILARLEDLATPAIIPARTGDDHLLVYGIPYLQIDEARRALSPDPEALLERDRPAVMRAAMDRIRADLRTRRAAGDPSPAIVMAHDHILGGQISSSERDLVIGTLSAVPLEVFVDNISHDDAATPPADISYLALGHLHGRQQPGAAALQAADQAADPATAEAGPLIHARYSGSPIRFSFSEEKHIKSVAIVELSATGPAHKHATLIKQVEIPQLRDMVTLDGSLDELCSNREQIERYKNAFVRARITDTHPENARARLAPHFPYLLAIETPNLARTISGGPSRELGVAPEPMALIEDFFTHAGGRKLTEEERALLSRLWEAACD